MTDGAARGASSADRRAFLEGVRKSLALGGRAWPPQLTLATSAPPASLEVPITDGPGLVERFAREALDAGASVSRADSFDALRAQIVGRVTAESVSEVVLGDTPLLAALELDEALERTGIRVTIAALRPSGPGRRELRLAAAQAAIGICEVEYGIAESGTLVVLHGPEQARLVSLLPPVHIAILRMSNLEPNLPAFFKRLAGGENQLGSALTFITGPSRTADIEFVLTTGVHGPGSLHVAVLGGE